jgi:hypothetical protein
LRLDPLSLPVNFDAHDSRADGGVRRIELHRERVVLRRALHGMQMAVSIRVCDFLGVGLRGIDDAQMLVLAHRDPSLTIPLCVSSDRDEIAHAWQMWCDILALPQLPEDKAGEPAARRRRHNAIRTRRPKFLVGRRGGDLLNPASLHQGEREIIARDGDNQRPHSLDHSLATVRPGGLDRLPVRVQRQHAAALGTRSAAAGRADSRLPSGDRTRTQGSSESFADGAIRLERPTPEPPLAFLPGIASSHCERKRSNPSPVIPGCAAWRRPGIHNHHL